MLTMDLLEFPLTGLRVKGTGRERTQLRLKKVKQVFGNQLASQVLRRDSLVLQLTGAVDTFICTDPQEGEPPKLVHIFRGDAQL